MEPMAIIFLFGMGIVGIGAFLIALNLRDPGVSILKTVFKAILVAVGFLASVATIIGIFLQLQQVKVPTVRMPEVTVAVMSAETATPAVAPTVVAPTVVAPTAVAPTVVAPTVVASPLLPDTFARLYYYSDLSTPQSDPNWPAISDDGGRGRTAYDAYGYTLHSEEEHGGWQIARNMNLFGDFALQIEITPLTPGKATAYSIGFDWTSDDSGYYFLVTGDERCSLIAVKRNVPTVVKQNDECPQLSRNALNKLLLIVEGQEFLAAMDNNVVLRSALDKRHGGPRVTLGVFSLEDDEAAEVRFNNLSIWQP